MPDTYFKCLLSGRIRFHGVKKSLFHPNSFVSSSSYQFVLDYIVLIPLQKTSTINVVSIERQTNVDPTDKNILHIGSGNNVDFIIYKNADSGKGISAKHCRGIDVKFQRKTRMNQLDLQLSLKCL